MSRTTIFLTLTTGALAGATCVLAWLYSDAIARRAEPAAAVVAEPKPTDVPRTISAAPDAARKPRPLFYAARDSIPPLPSLTSPKIEQALAREVEWSFVGLPLADVVEFIAIDTGVSVFLSPQGPNVYPENKRWPVTLMPGRRTVETALGTIAKQADRDWTVVDDMIWIGTSESVDEQLLTRLYPIDDLLGTNADGLVPAPAAEQFERMIVDHAWPDDWAFDFAERQIGCYYVGGRRILIVRQNYRIQKRVAELLTQLRGAAELGGPAVGANGGATDVRQAATASALIRRAVDQHEARPIGKPQHGLTLTGLRPGEEARVRYTSSGCWHYTQHLLTFRGERPDEIVIEEVVHPDNQRLVQPLGSLRLTRDERRNLNLCLDQFRNHADLGGETAEIEWFVEGKLTGRETLTWESDHLTASIGNTFRRLIGQAKKELEESRRANVAAATAP